MNAQTETRNSITTDDRGLAAWTHLSGLAGYIIPLGGVIVPLAIWWAKSESAEIAGIAKQAILLNVIVFAAVLATVVMMLTIILIPLILLFWVEISCLMCWLPYVNLNKCWQTNRLALSITCHET